MKSQPAVLRAKEANERSQTVTSSTSAWTIYESPLGPLTIAVGPRGITGLGFPGKLHPDEAAKRQIPEVTEQLEAYFAGERQRFDLPLDLQGTSLQLAVWRELLAIPYGSTLSYGELAARSDPSLFHTQIEPWQRARAVGAANARNPVSIVVPCHRVIGADGSLTGYAGGLQRKQALLELEQRTSEGHSPPSSWRDRQLVLG
jgi:methylated-DNA-[protein]-cysteine S-methyltransferase